MAVFDNLRNFIRHGKAAEKRGLQPSNSAAPSIGSVSVHSDTAPTSVVSAPPETTSSSHLELPVPPVIVPDRVPSPSTAQYTPAVQKIIAEENESRNRIPSLPGLEKYSLIEKMGDGAFSVVYKARDLETGEMRAIKVVGKANLSSSQKASVLKEAVIVRQLDHPNITKMHAFLETPDHYFIVLELVPGGELFHQIVRLTYFSEDLSRHVIIQVAHAIRYLHDVAGVVHRDIKPENLLFQPIDIVPSKKPVLRSGDDDSKEDEGEFTPGIGGGGIGQIKLADFGLSKIVWNTKTMTPCGTVGYTAPEIVKDERYSKSVDMWALGCVLYTVLCGFPPFYDESIETLTRKVAKGQYTFLSPWWDEISMSAKDLVSRLLTVDPEKRYTIDEFFAHPWITQDGTVPVESYEVAAHKSTTTLPGERRTRDPALDMALKDAFDVSNAVYRMEEETQNQRVIKPTDAILEEEDEDFATAHVENIAQNLGQVQLQEVARANPRMADITPLAAVPNSPLRNHNAASAAPPQRQSQRANERERERASKHAPAGPVFFDLRLEGATLLERRRQNKRELIA